MNRRLFLGGGALLALSLLAQANLVIQSGGTAVDPPGSPGGGGALPSWTTGLSVGEWVQPTAGNTIRDVAACPADNCSYSGPDGLMAIGYAWNGGDFWSDWGNWGGISAIGGGHNTYFGNEVYVLDLETLQWERISNPTTDISNGTDGSWDSDGGPIVGHTYQLVPWRTGHNEMWMFIGHPDEVQAGPAGGHCACTSVLTPIEGSVVGPSAWDRLASDDAPGNITAFSAVYDDERDVFYVPTNSPSALHKVDPTAAAGSRVTTMVGSFLMSITVPMEIVPTTDEIVVVDVRGDGAPTGVGLYTMNILSPAQAVEESISGDTAAFLATEVGGVLTWCGTCGSAGLLVYYGLEGDLFTIDPDGWVIDQLPNTGVVPDEPDDQSSGVGPYGKGGLVEGEGQAYFIMSHDVDIKPHVYRIQ